MEKDTVVDGADEGPDIDLTVNGGDPDPIDETDEEQLESDDIDE